MRSEALEAYHGWQMGDLRPKKWDLSLSVSRIWEFSQETVSKSWWRHGLETLLVIQVLCERNPLENTHVDPFLVFIPRFVKKKYNNITRVSAQLYKKALAYKLILLWRRFWANWYLLHITYPYVSFRHILLEMLHFKLGFNGIIFFDATVSTKIAKRSAKLASY